MTSEARFFEMKQQEGAVKVGASHMCPDRIRATPVRVIFMENSDEYGEPSQWWY